MNIQRIANFINKSPRTQKILKGINNNPALYSAGIGFITASIFRPIGQSVLPIKDKKDKAYTIGSSVATGVTELALAMLLFIPANKIIQATSKVLYNSSKETIYKENSLLLRQFKSLSNRFLKIGLMPLTSWLRFVAIAPFVKILFRKDKEIVASTQNIQRKGLNYEG